MSKFSISEHFACTVLGQHRSTHRKNPRGRADEEALTADIIRLATRYDRYRPKGADGISRSNPDEFAVSFGMVEIWCAIQNKTANSCIIEVSI